MHIDDLNVGKVDCTAELAKPLCKEYKVDGYPSLYFFPIEQGNNGKYF